MPDDRKPDDKLLRLPPFGASDAILEDYGLRRVCTGRPMLLHLAAETQRVRDQDAARERRRRQVRRRAWLAWS